MKSTVHEVMMKSTVYNLRNKTKFVISLPTLKTPPTVANAQVYEVLVTKTTDDMVHFKLVFFSFSFSGFLTKYLTRYFNSSNAGSLTHTAYKKTVHELKKSLVFQNKNDAQRFIANSRNKVSPNSVS